MQYYRRRRRGEGGEEKDVSSGQWQLVVLKAKARGRRKRSKQWSVLKAKAKARGDVAKGQEGEGEKMRRMWNLEDGKMGTTKWLNVNSPE